MVWPIWAKLSFHIALNNSWMEHLTGCLMVGEYPLLENEPKVLAKSTNCCRGAHQREPRSLRVADGREGSARRW